MAKAATAMIQKHESKTEIVPQNVGASPPLDDLFPVTVGGPRAQEFVDLVSQANQSAVAEVQKPIPSSPPPTAEVADFSPDLGADVLFWQEQKDDNGKLVLVPIPGKLVWRSKLNPDLWRVMLFMSNGRISDRIDAGRSDRPKARCWTMKS